MGMSLEERKKIFIELFHKLEKKYENSEKRLAGEGWDFPWKMVLVTICSAQNRDEVTIPVMEEFFKKFDSLEKIAGADVKAIRKGISRINYCDNKSKYLKECARQLLERYGGNVPDDIEELITLSGVGRKTANLVITEVHKLDGICVDTHVHRISNVYGIVDTKTPEQTEFALREVSPKKYWSRINRLFVLFGKDVTGRNKEKFEEFLER